MVLEAVAVTEKVEAHLDEFRVQIYAVEILDSCSVVCEDAEVLAKAGSDIEEFLVGGEGRETGEDMRVERVCGDVELEEAEGGYAWVGIRVLDCFGVLGGC